MKPMADAWYADAGADPPTPGWANVCQRMRELEKDEVFDTEAAIWAAFARFIGSDALSQEMYGEYLFEGGPDPLGPMWSAFRAGWGAGAGQYGH